VIYADPGDKGTKKPELSLQRENNKFQLWQNQTFIKEESLTFFMK